MMARTQAIPGRGQGWWARLRWLWVGGAVIAAAGIALGGADPYRGLWAGQITLNFVNEVPVVLDEENQPVAPDVKVATPTADQAHLRLLLHVSGAGQVSLLRDVAILARSSEVGGGGSSGVVDLKQDLSGLRYVGNRLARESDLALVTDERLYGVMPPQPAVRFASAVFDFGDSRTTAGVEAVIRAAADRAAAELKAGRTADEAKTEARASAQQVVDTADVAAAFGVFLRDDVPRAVVDKIATGDAGALATARAAAQVLQARSAYFQDSRGVAMVEAVWAAAEGVGADAVLRKAAAQSVAAAYADLADEYHRFLAGKVFGDMIAGTAARAAVAAVQNGATLASIGLAMAPEARGARSNAVALAALSPYVDARPTNAVEVVFTAVQTAAAAQLPADPSLEPEIRARALKAGESALAEQVARYRVPKTGPTADYNTFVQSAEFKASPALAAEAAAKAGLAALTEDPFLTELELAGLVRDAVTDALRVGSPNAFLVAAQAARRELPLTGVFGVGQGDARLSHAIQVGGLAPLGAPALTGSIFLPASHPTNPYRHRRHPDHRYGLDITREVRLDFDGVPGGSPEPAGYGVDRITGVYREELFGLHKPLGQGKNVGLRVEGRFELHRISLIDALNAP